MTFFERWFGVSPDGGNGSVELAVIVLAIAAVVLWFTGYRVRRNKVT